jgi:Zn finger protein HypA/HybF involved in hydrogenase expression
MVCNDCNNIFPFRNEIPQDLKSKEEILEAMQKINQCPKCGSSKIEPMHTSLKMLKQFKSGEKTQKK